MIIELERYKPKRNTLFKYILLAIVIIWCVLSAWMHYRNVQMWKSWYGLFEEDITIEEIQPNKEIKI